jgi:predicted PhzF superfamily epimerase YddE/YHI9
MLLRFFAPWSGVNEDPVCGSASIMAGPFWAARLGKAQFQVRQCSLRGGDLFVSVDAAAGRVDVAGAAVLVSKGVLYLN